MSRAGEPRPDREIIWSPWRMEYLRAEKPEGCVFCEIGAAAADRDEEHRVVWRGRTHFVVLNIWPYNNGHAMVVPYRHIEDITQLTDEETLEMMKGARGLVTAYREGMNAEGVNAGINLGRVSGGSIPHLHLHLVPRWTGDSNFMPIVGQTRVLVEMLEETWRRLRAASGTWDHEEAE